MSFRQVVYILHPWRNIVAALLSMRIVFHDLQNLKGLMFEKQFPTVFSSDLLLLLCLYVCMYVCMYVCTCMHVAFNITDKYLSGEFFSMSRTCVFLLCSLTHSHTHTHTQSLSACHRVPDIIESNIGVMINKFLEQARQVNPAPASCLKLLHVIWNSCHIFPPP